MDKLFIVILPIIAGGFIGTYRLAKAFHYHDALGQPLFHLGETPIYLPWMVIVWFMETREIEALFNVAKKELLWLYWGAFLGFAAVYSMLQKKKAPDYHGSASWGTLATIEKAGLLKDKTGVVLGFMGGRITDSPDVLKNMPLIKRIGAKIENFLNPLFKPMHIMMHDGPEHILTLAPTRSGKGIGIILPTLLYWTQSVLVLDIKGENWAISAGYRQKVMGQKVLKFEPTNSKGTAARFNPLSEIRKGTFMEIQDIQNIANILVNPQGKSDMDHWEKSGQALLTAVIAHLIYTEDNASLARTAEFLQVSEDGSNFFARLDALAEYEHDSEHTGIFKEIYSESHMAVVKSKPYCHPLVRQMAVDMKGKSENERASIVSTCTTTLSLFSDPLLAKNTAVSDFAISDLMNYDQAVSLYLIIPPSDINRLAPITRMIIDLIIRRNTNDMDFANAKPAPKYKHKMLLLLDEFPAIGRMDTLEIALGFIAGYGLKVLLIAQDLSQLNKAYTKDNTIVGNCHIQIYYAPNKIDTAEEVSRLLGKRTIEVVTKSRKEKSMATMFDVATENSSYMGRELMTATELREMPMKHEVISVTGHKAIFANKFFYYETRMFTDRLLAAPERSDRTAPDKIDLFGDTDEEDFTYNGDLPEEVAEEIPEEAEYFEQGEAEDEKELAAIEE